MGEWEYNFLDKAQITLWYLLLLNIIKKHVFGHAKIKVFSQQLTPTLIKGKLKQIFKKSLTKPRGCLFTT